MTTDEPLAEASARARQLAATSCSPDCDWYHGLWPTLRILGVAADPGRHDDFFARALGSLARSGSFPNVLVSGTADYSMLAHTVRAYRAHGAEVRPRVVDRCRTPLALCRWYGELVGVTVETTVSDILELDATDPLDVVCTHSFLSQFPPARRPDLVAVWRAVLRPGGRVVTTTRLNPPDTPDVLLFGPDQVEAFCAQVAEEAPRHRHVLGVTGEELVAAARTYARGLSLHPTRSVDELRHLFEAGGFRVERLEVRRLVGTLRRGLSGPGTSQDGSYAEMVVVRA